MLQQTKQQIPRHQAHAATPHFTCDSAENQTGDPKRWTQRKHVAAVQGSPLPDRGIRCPGGATCIWMRCGILPVILQETKQKIRTREHAATTWQRYKARPSQMAVSAALVSPPVVGCVVEFYVWFCSKLNRRSGGLKHAAEPAAKHCSSTSKSRDPLRRCLKASHPLPFWHADLASSSSLASPPNLAGGNSSLVPRWALLPGPQWSSTAAPSMGDIKLVVWKSFDDRIHVLLKSKSVLQLQTDTL